MNDNEKMLRRKRVLDDLKLLCEMWEVLSNQESKLSDIGEEHLEAMIVMFGYPIIMTSMEKAFCEGIDYEKIIPRIKDLALDYEEKGYYQITLKK